MRYLALSRSKRVSASRLVRWPFLNPGFHHGAWPIGSSAMSSRRLLVVRWYSTSLVLSGVSPVSPAKKHDTDLVSNRYIFAALRHLSKAYRLPVCVAGAAKISTLPNWTVAPGSKLWALAYPRRRSHFATDGGA